MPNAANGTPDFVMVQLTAAGQAQAAGAPLRLSNGRRSFLFSGTEAVKVELSYEWRKVLAQAITRSGEPMFEIAPAAPASAATILAPLVAAASASAPAAAAEAAK